jgi:hypothetical protein
MGEMSIRMVGRRRGRDLRTRERKEGLPSGENRSQYTVAVYVSKTSVL